MFINLVGTAMATSFISFILRRPDYYAVAGEDIGTVMSYVNLYSEFVLIAMGFFIGPIMDLFGRVKIVVAGQFMSGVAYILFT